MESDKVYKARGLRKWLQVIIPQGSKHVSTADEIYSASRSTYYATTTPRGLAGTQGHAELVSSAVL